MIESTPGQDRIKAASEAQRALQDISYELLCKGNAARELCLHEQAEMFYDLAAAVRTHGDALHKCWSYEFYQRCDEGHAATGNMLMAALAMCGVDKANSKEQL